MEAVQNIIRKQTVNFQYNGNTDGFALQKEVSDWCKFILIPEIEQQLELFDLGDDYITIDKLALDVVTVRKDWQQKIRNELVYSLNRKLRDYKTGEKKIQDEQKTESRLHKLDELIIFYFEKGYLPWWSKAFADNNFDTVLTGWISEEKSQSRSEAIISQLRQINTGPVIQRILNQVPGRLFFKFIQHLFKGAIKSINEAEAFSNELLKAATFKTEQKRILAAFNKVLLTMLIKNNGKIDVEMSLQVFRAILKNEKFREVAVEKRRSGTARLSDNPFIKVWQDLLSEETRIKSNRDIELTIKDSKHAYHRIIDELTKRSFEKNNKEQIAGELREGIYIENGGAVIIAAFLPRLFERLKIAGKAAIINPELGALLIQYIVSGKTKAQEHELVLPKILCGMSPQLPVKIKRLTKTQQSEADEMLAAVIEHWAVLKGTSIEGLRESFLQRSAKLIRVEEEWLLQVEQKAYDMLLQQLPWNISMIKLPWMTGILKTEWV